MRHGTLSFVVNLNVVTGTVEPFTVGPTRTTGDFLKHIQETVQREPEVKRWHIVADNLNTHCSEALVRYVAELSGREGDLGAVGQYGILQSMKSGAAFLREPHHKVVSHYTLKHASWLNQIEIWFSILARKVIRRGNFTSTQELERKVRSFIDYFNKTMAAPFNGHTPERC